MAIKIQHEEYMDLLVTWPLINVVIQSFVDLKYKSMVVAYKIVLVCEVIILDVAF